MTIARGPHVRLAATVMLVMGTVAGLRATDDPPQPPPSWLQAGGEYRFRIESVDGARFQAGNDDSYTLSRLRLGLTLQPAASWRFVLQAQDSRVFLKNQHPSRPPFRDVIDARLAYAEFTTTSKTGVSARVGRQELAFGEQRLIGTADWLNTGRTFDAFRATVRHAKVVADAFAGYVVSARADRFDRPDPGNVLYGVNLVLADLVPHATVEPYVFGRRAPNQTTEAGAGAVLHSGTMGVRWMPKAPGNVDAGSEIAAQIGSMGADRVRAWAGHWTLGYRLPDRLYQPRIAGEYNYASGDRDRHDGRRNTFDQLFATGHDKYGLSDQVGWKNVHHLRGGVELHPTKKLLTTVRYHSWWLASIQDALYDAGGALVVRAADGSAGRHVGQELDVQAVLSAPGKAKVAAGYAHLFPGGFLEHATDGHAYSYPYISFNVGF
jgi:hypothetical protein